MSQREGALSARIVEALCALPGTHAEKVWTGGRFAVAGRPDVTGCRNGRRFEIEVKLPGGRARKVQAARLALWERSGCAVGVATSISDAVAIVEAL